MAHAPQNLVPIGYFPKKVVHRPQWLNAQGVTAIRSVSTCISEGPDNWIENWTHNDLGLYSTIAAAIAVVLPSERSHFELHAYRMLPQRWQEGVATDFAVPVVAVEPVPEDFQPIGYDVVVLEPNVLGFGCSPLSCNYMAKEIATNPHCLLEKLDEAIRTAEEFSRSSSGVEPGPYHVVEVLFRERS